MKKFILFLLLTSFAFADLTFDLKNAIKKNDVEKVKNLIENGATPDASIINQSLKDKNYELFKLLIDTGIYIESTDSENISIFSNACMYGNKEIVDMLLEKGAYIESRDSYNNTPIYSAIEKNNIEVVKELIEKGAEKYV